MSRVAPESKAAAAARAAASGNREGLLKGAKVWYKQDAQTWVLGEILKTPAAMSDTGPFAIQVSESGKVIEGLDMLALAPANPALQLGIPDLTHLSYLNEPGILHNLQHRYTKDDIYTLAGPVLIALNPCKPVPLYTQDVANAYKAGTKDVTNSAALPPHIYLVAAAAFRKMVREKQSQSLIVNGESGAGKTETTKKAMQYFAMLAGGTGIEDQVLETNPILEAFGNAKTLRNHNSSRFGKLIQIHFNNSHHICGALIKTYLLEKSRVVHQLQGERSYHIFYQLVRGATQEERASLGLPPAEKARAKGGVTDFKFLAQSGCTDIDGVDDAAEFSRVRSALADIGIDPTAQAALWRALAGVLWLGNLEFEANGEDATNDSTKVKQNDALGWASKLLGVTPEHLVTALTTRRIQAPGEIIVKLLNVTESRDARDALAKALYSALFDWVVAAINARLDTGKRTSGLSISILDIYGFEQFVRNSFEQLCINYANERLQQQFTRHLFTLEQQEYESEGIDWTKIEFVDNQECVDVIEMAPPKGLGVLAILDAQCRFPKATDATLYMKLKESLAAHTHFSVNPRAQQEFVVTHYAGNVAYDCTGFLDKNKDTLSADIVELLAESVCELVGKLGRGLKEEMEGAARRGMTVGTRFMGQLRELITDLDATGLHFVRCIKPNAALAPSVFEAPMTLHQLRCCGVLEVARVAAAGFPTRYTHAQFAQRYAILLPPEEQMALQRTSSGGGSQSLQACQMLIAKFGLVAGQYQLGRTKVFFRPGVLGLVEDRWARMHKSVTRIQATWRMYVKRRDFLALRQAAVVVQALWLARSAKRQLEELRLRNQAAIVIQKNWRCFAWRSNYQMIRNAAITIQVKGYRRWKFRKWLAACMQAQDKERRERERQDMMRRLEQESFQALRREHNVDMAGVRTALAAWSSCREVGISSLEQLNDVLITWKDGGLSQSAPAAAAAVAVAVEEPTAAASEPLQAALVPDAQVASQPAPHTIAGAASAATMATVAAAQAAAAAAQPAVAVPGLSRAVAMSPAVANRFELAKELTIQVERLHLENIKLQKQLQLERSLKDRYQHKYEEQNVNWLEQIRVLQQYIQQVRSTFGDTQLPPMPRQVASTTQPEARAVGAAGEEGEGGDEAMMMAGATPQHNLSSGGSKVGAAIAAVEAREAEAVQAQRAASQVAATTQTDPPPLPPAKSVSEAATVTDPMPAPQPAVVPKSTAETQTAVAAANGVSDMGILTGAAAATVFANEAAAAAVNSSDSSLVHAAAQQNAVQSRGVAGGAAGMREVSVGSGMEEDARSLALSQGSALGAAPVSPVGPYAHIPQPQPQQPPLPPPGPQMSASQRYVNQLSAEMDRVGQVLVDDVSFIREVREGAADAPDMDPGAELFKLKKKFEVWKREFKEKLKTTEEVLRKIDRMERKQAVPANLQPSRSMQVSLPAAPAGQGQQLPSSASMGAVPQQQQGAVQRTTPPRPPPAANGAGRGAPTPSPEVPKTKSKIRAFFS